MSDDENSLWGLGRTSESYSYSRDDNYNSRGRDRYEEEPRGGERDSREYRGRGRDRFEGDDERESRYQGGHGRDRYEGERRNRYDGDRRDREHHGGRNRNQDSKIPDLYSIHEGKVVSIKEFGAFIEIKDHSIQGLLHKSQICAERIENVENVLQVGDPLKVKVITIGESTDNQRPKISLSMRFVAQRDGRDLDPNNVELFQSLERKKPYKDYKQSIIKLDAVLPTTCSKCGASGHLEFECYTGKSDGKGKYDLIEEFDAVPPAVIEPKASQSQIKASKLKIDKITNPQEALAILQLLKEEKKQKKEKKRRKKERKLEKKEKKERKKREKRKERDDSPPRKKSKHY